MIVMEPGIHWVHKMFSKCSQMFTKCSQMFTKFGWPHYDCDSTWYSLGSQILSALQRASSLPSLQSRRPSQTRDLDDHHHFDDHGDFDHFDDHGDWGFSQIIDPPSLSEKFPKTCLLPLPHDYDSDYLSIHWPLLHVASVTPQADGGLAVATAPWEGAQNFEFGDLNGNITEPWCTVQKKHSLLVKLWFRPG